MNVAGILSDEAILASLKDGSIQITPFDEAQLNGASYDLTLGDGLAVYEPWVHLDGQGHQIEDGRHFRPTDGIYDVKKEPEIKSYKIDPEKGWVLRPRIGYLMHTRERIRTDKFEPVVDGKSSIGRLFTKVHATAGYGDPGFDGQYTLEVEVTHAIRIYPGMRIGQIRFHTICGHVTRLYAGNYTGDGAKGAVASRAWRQFK